MLSLSPSRASILVAALAAGCLVSQFLPSFATTTPRDPPHRHRGLKRRLPRKRRGGREKNPPSHYNDPKTVEYKPRAVAAGVDLSMGVGDGAAAEGGDRLCIASVDDGEVRASSLVADDGAYLNLALPPGRATELTVECTVTDDEGAVHLVERRNEVVLPGSVEAGSCDLKALQPGYHDVAADAWVVPCTGRSTRFIGEELRGELVALTDLSREGCPVPAAVGGGDVWVSLVGDSMMRHVFYFGLGKDRLFKLDKLGGVRRFWKQHGGNDKHAMLIGIALEGAGRTIWFSYSLSFIDCSAISCEELEDVHPTPHSWGDFVNITEVPCGEGPGLASCPAFPPHRRPDVVFYGPGYHATALDPPEYAAAIRRVLDRFAADAAGSGARPPTLHLVNNVVPAAWLIPDAYDWDRPHRTIAREVGKTMATMAVASERNDVSTVVDYFSVELPFQGREEDGMDGTCHKDAVHVGDKRLIRYVADVMIDRICHMA